MKRPWLPLHRFCLSCVAGLSCLVPTVCSAALAAGPIAPGPLAASPLAATSIAGAPAASTSDFAAPAAAATDEWVPVAEQVLADARGGFDAGNGLLVSLSVDRVLSLNGNVIASGQLSTADAVASGFQVARIGVGNALLNGAQPLAGLLLQNSANDQLIRSQTTIDATVNSLSILKDMHFGDSLRQSLSSAIVPR